MPVCAGRHGVGLRHGRCICAPAVNLILLAASSAAAAACLHTGNEHSFAHLSHAIVLYNAKACSIQLCLAHIGLPSAFEQHSTTEDSRSAPGGRCLTDSAHTFQTARSDAATLRRGARSLLRGVSLASAINRWARAAPELSEQLRLLPEAHLPHVARAVALLKVPPACST